MGCFPRCLGTAHESDGRQMPEDRLLGQKLGFEMIEYRAEDRRLKSEMGI
jgi:hypothetical protein